MIYPLADQPQGPITGEDVLTSMLQWGTGRPDGPGSLAGLIELNWVARDDLGQVSDRVVGRRAKPLFSLTIEQAIAMLGTVARDGLTPNTIFFTGADPAGHPQLGEFLQLARQSGISQIGLQCSGPRLAHDDDLLDMLIALKPLLFVEFDGFDETASLILHGRRDLPFEVRRGLDRLAAAGLPTALLISVVQGVNLQEVGAIATFGLNHPAVFSAIFRPIQAPIAHLGGGQTGQVTAARIMAALEQQSNGLFRQDAFAPILRRQPEQHFYAQVPYAGQNGSAVHSRPGAHSGKIAHDASCFWLGVHEFMTPCNQGLSQAQRCPLVIMTPDGRKTPYCLYDAAE
jgi:uncharacterized radical SAM superfamily Fe-S cluster-containing enzyme